MRLTVLRAGSRSARVLSLGWGAHSRSPCKCSLKVQEHRSRVIVLTGAAPYLGGPQTWEPLRLAAPEIDFAEIDTLAFAQCPDIGTALRNRIAEDLHQADGIVAHGSTARIAVEAVAAVDPSIAVLLLSPQLLTRTTPIVAAVRALLAGPLGKAALLFAARTKHRRLGSHRNAVRKELAAIVAGDAIRDSLVDEAARRIADPLTARAVERTHEVVRLALEPVDAEDFDSLMHVAVILGTGPMERWRQENGTATIVEGARSAPMLDAPRVVAGTLRRLLASREG